MSASATDPAFRILLVVSRPIDQPDFSRLGDQWALINGLRTVNASSYLKILRPPTIEALRTEILAGYDVVHFDGHGAFGLCCPNCGMLHAKSKKKCDRCSASLEDQKEGGYLAFERQDGAMDSLSAQDLAEIVAFPGSPTKLVILSACKSAAGNEKGILQTLIDNDIPAIVGMNEIISPEATAAFFTPFYAAIGAGMSISYALKRARSSLVRFEDSGQAVSSIPQLEGDGKDAKLVESGHAGSAVHEQEFLFGVPQYKFVGDYIRDDPPRGRNGYVSRLIQAFLDNEKFVVLTGQGGIGKTILASETARRLAWRFPGGVFWRSAIDIKSLGLNELLDAFVDADVFGAEFRQQTVEAKRIQVLKYLRNYDTPSLLVVDNAERIKDQQVWNFLEGIPQPSAALVTTRDGLPYGCWQIHIEEMEEHESKGLFVQEASRQSLRWKKILRQVENLSTTEQQYLSEISSLLEGHPLGLKVAAGMLSSVSLRAIRESLVMHPPKEVSDRFDFSYDLLPENEKELLQRMAAFSGSVSAEAIVAICANGDNEAISCSEALGELVRKSFVDVIESKVTRYKIHPLMRQYAAGKAGDVKFEEARLNTALSFLIYAKNFKRDFDVIELEKENILASMDWAVEQMHSSCKIKEYAKVVSMFMDSMFNYMDVKGYWEDLRLRLGQAIEAENLMGDKKGASIWIHNLGVLSQDICAYDDARELYQQCLKISEELGDKDGIATTLHQLGVLNYIIYNYDEAQKLYLHSLKIAQKLDNKDCLANILHDLGILAQTKGNYDDARKFYQQGFEIFNEVGDKCGVSRSLHQLGILDYLIDDYDTARKFYQQSLQIASEIGNKLSMSQTLHQLAGLAEVTGDYDEAYKLYQRSLELSKELGNMSGVASTLHNLGNLAFHMRDYDEAYKLYLQSLEIEKKLGDTGGISRTLHQLSFLALCAGNSVEAREICEESLKIRAKLGDKSGMSGSFYQLGLLAEVSGSYDEAHDFYLQSLEIKRKLGDKRGISQVIYQLGMLAQEMSDYEEARKYFQQSIEINIELRDKSGYAFSLSQLALLEKETGNIPKAIEMTQQAELIFSALGQTQDVKKARKQRKQLEEN